MEYMEVLLVSQYILSATYLSKNIYIYCLPSVGIMPCTCTHKTLKGRSLYFNHDYRTKSHIVIAILPTRLQTSTPHSFHNCWRVNKELQYMKWWKVLYTLTDENTTNYNLHTKTRHLQSLTQKGCLRTHAWGVKLRYMTQLSEPCIKKSRKAHSKESEP